MVTSLLVLPSWQPGRAELDPRDSQSPFGVLAFLNWDHDWNSHTFPEERLGQAADLLHEAGVAFVRMDFLWDDIEPAPGKFDFKKYDHIVEILTSRNIKILGLLSYNAVWAAEYWNSAPDPVKFTRYAEAVVERYKGRVKYWEIWNEPDEQNYWRQQDGLKGYTELLKSVYPAMKAVDPTCVVLMGGVSHTIPFSLKNIYRNGGKAFFDAVNFHPFVDPRSPSAPELLRGIYLSVYRTMEEFNDADKEIWITEIGCPGVNPDKATSGWWLGRAPSEEEQAAWVKKAYAEILSWKGVRRVFWAFFRDTPNYFQNAIDYFGLIRNDFSKKPSFETYKRLTQTTD